MEQVWLFCVLSQPTYVHHAQQIMRWYCITIRGVTIHRTFDAAPILFRPCDSRYVTLIFDSIFTIECFGILNYVITRRYCWDTFTNTIYILKLNYCEAYTQPQHRLINIFPTFKLMEIDNAVRYDINPNCKYYRLRFRFMSETRKWNENTFQIYFSLLIWHVVVEIICKQHYYIMKQLSIIAFTSEFTYF